MAAVERAVDGSVEPSSGTAAPGGAGAEAGAPMSEARLPPAPPPPQEELVGAERAADLSARQLAAVERLLERDVEPEESRAALLRAGPPPAERLGLLVRKLGDLVERLAAAAAGARKAVDRRLVPYSLSCKALLGIAGLVTLAVVGALSFKIWILPWMRSGGG